MPLTSQWQGCMFCCAWVFSCLVCPLFGRSPVAATSAKAGNEVIKSELAAWNCSAEANAVLPTLQSQLQQLRAELSNKANVTDKLSKAEILEHSKLYDAALEKHKVRVQALESALRRLKEGLEQKADRGLTMTKEEVHERYKLYNASQKTVLHAGIKLELRQLQAGLDAKANRSSTMTKEKIDERFTLFHENQKAALSDLSINELIPHIERLEAALNETASELRRLESDLKSRSGGVGWISFLLGMSLTTALALAACCLATAAHKQTEDRIKEFEATMPAQTNAADGITALADVHDEVGPNFNLKAISGVVGASVGGATGATVGTAVGGVCGAIAGLVPAVFTFGLSIPVGAAIGSGLGLASGAAIGSGGGALGGIKAIAWYKRRKHREQFSTEEVTEEDEEEEDIAVADNLWNVERLKDH